MKTTAFAISLVLLPAALLMGSGTAVAQGCKREPEAQWPVRLERGVPIIDGAINGTKAKILVDTGAYASLVGNATAQRLKLKVDYGTEERLKGGYRVGVTTLDTFRIGDTEMKGPSMRVAGDLGAVDVILGIDFIRRFDLELDLPGGFVRAFRPGNCPGESLAYWDAKAFEVGLEKATFIGLPVSVNGKRATAVLFSGTGITAVTPEFAEAAGVKPGGPGVFPGGCTTAGDPMWIGRFDAIAVGARTVADARIDIRPLQTRGVDVYLGSDFLKTHRVLLSLSRGTMYFTDAGGLPFTAVPNLACDPDMRGKSRKERLARVDAALTRNSRDAEALLWRGWLLQQEQPKQAIADLDAVIALEPANPVAYSLRGEARSILDDRQGAIADFGSAASHGMVSVALHAHRGDLRGKVGDYPGAIEDYGQALRIDPRHVGSLRARGRQHYHAGKYEEAERDFTKLVAVSPGEVNAIWLSLALARRGLDSRAALEVGRRHVKDEQWPAPILDYLLGRLDREGLMAKSAVADAKVRKEQECEARYYVAARLLVDGKPGEARPLLERAQAECPRHFIEYDSAIIDLKGMS